MYSAAVTNRNDTCRWFFFFVLFTCSFIHASIVTLHEHYYYYCHITGARNSSRWFYIGVLFLILFFFSCLVWIDICIYKYICPSTTKRNSRTNVSVIHKAPHSKNGKCGKYGKCTDATILNRTQILIIF